MHFYYDIDVWEMYDLENDPDELHNLYYDEDFAGLRDSLSRELVLQQQKYKDTGSIEDFRKITDYRYKAL